jgi:hypothetical protein
VGDELKVEKGQSLQKQHWLRDETAGASLPGYDEGQVRSLPSVIAMTKK